MGFVPAFEGWLDLLIELACLPCPITMNPVFDFGWRSWILRARGGAHDMVYPS